ncbi:MAG TPA: putative zinc-binding protein [Solirubrobacterales bacterium]|nr:putative zinc-binding protein [Solirubrobacterales bacterium]
MLAYSCSGSSNVAQLANYIAVRLDRLGIAEMSCIVGVGGDVRALVKKATAGRPVLAIDGCPLSCCEAVLGAKGVEPERLIRLHEMGLKKRQHVDFDPQEREFVFRRVLEELAPDLLAADPSLEPRINAAIAGTAASPQPS